MVLLLLGFAPIIVIDLIPVLRRRSMRSVIAILLLFIPAFTMVILQYNGVKVPSAMIQLERVVRGLGLNYK